MVETLTIRSGVAKPAILPVAQPAPRAGRSAVRSPTGTPAAGGPDDDSNLGPRHGDAAVLAEIARFDHGDGRDFAARVGDQTEAIEREVGRRVGAQVDPEVVKRAVADAREQI